MSISRKKPSRARQHDEELRRAAEVPVPRSADVCVIGGGAAGLVAAICAAEAGARVVALEARPSCGQSILATGNGRCNFANVSVDGRRYANWDFVEQVFGASPLDDVLAFFRASGMRWQLEGDRLYPMSFQAASVRSVLMRRAEEAGVILAPARKAIAIQALQGGRWQVAYGLDRGERAAAGHDSVTASALVICCGPLAPLLNQLCRNLGLGYVAPRPVLCPVTCADAPALALDGRRVHGALSLVKGMFPMWRERGEVMLRSYGLSGVVTFNLSRRAEEGDRVLLDLVPDLSKSELRQIVDPFAGGTFDDRALDGVVDPQIASLLARLARERWQPEGIELETWGARAEDSDAERLIALAKALPFTVTGVRGQQAQVHAGGLSTAGFSPETLAAEGHPTLFAAGEVLDVDADCGGYNLMWAWKSGMVAGAAAARAAEAASA